MIEYTPMSTTPAQPDRRLLAMFLVAVLGAAVSGIVTATVALDWAEHAKAEMRTAE